MDKGEKKLLIIDLCARLPYGVKMLFNNEHKFTLDQINPRQFAGKDGRGVIFDFGGKVYSVDDCKPYLRPLSSMTEEEKEELRQEHIKDEQLFADCIKNHPEMRGKVIPHFAADWCNKYHFNYRLPEHLFITVTETNNPYKA